MEKEESPGQIFTQLGEFVRGLSAGQQAMLLVGALAVAATLYGFVRLIAEPKYATLYSGLKPQDAQSLASRLTAKSIDNKVSSDGASLMVPEDKLDAARLETASQGLPRNARMGFELFDTPNWAGSDFTEKVNYQRALEGELERTLQTLSEVEAVRVHLVLPHESLFTDQDHEAKAAVIVKTRGGALSAEAQAAIPQLVASAVERLRPEGVTVVDADSDASLVHSRGMLGGSGGSSTELDLQLAQAIVHTLEPVVGADHVRASVHVEYDPSSSERTEETYDPKAVATLTAQRADETAGGTAGGGIPGTASNVPGSQPGGTKDAKAPGAKPGDSSVAAGTEGDHQTSHSESTTFAVSRTTSHTLQPAGRLKRLTAAVLVDDAELPPAEALGDKPVVKKTDKKTDVKTDGASAGTRRKRTPEEMKELEQLARAAIGADTSRGDLLAVENISFRQNPAETPIPPSQINTIRALLREWSETLRYLGVTILFLFVYFIVLRPVKKQALDTFRQLAARAKGAAAENSEADVLPGADTRSLDSPAPAVSEDRQRAKQLKQQMAEKIKAEPAAAGRLVQTWMKEG